MQQKKRILICPLDWGLGHATRCIPIIHKLLQKNAEVFIGGNGRSLALLKKEFPQLVFIDLPGYDIQYANGSLALKIFLSTPKIFKAIGQEHTALEKIIVEKKIDLVLSDNRFGLWNKQIKTVFITHQLVVKAPIVERLLYRINQYYIKKFDECWIPDRADETNLSGDLSRAYPMPANAFYIGLLSRFQQPVESTVKSMFTLKSGYDAMVIISGPEPQRSIFEKIILQQAASIPLNFLIVKGITETSQTKESKGNLDIVSHLPSAEMREAILSSSVIISRSGYSTIMDLAVLNKKAIFIPTPGQTEQEYLAQRCMKNKTAYTETQTAFDLKRALKEAEKYKGFSLQQSAEIQLDKRIATLMDTVASDAIPSL